MPEHLLDMARAERETLRWILLLALSYSRPVACNESLLLRTAHDAGLRVTTDMVRAELDYLKNKGLLYLNNNEAFWTASITPDGMDIVDHRADCPKGIARPPRWS
jgi:hypothetical protein